MNTKKEATGPKGVEGRNKTADHLLEHVCQLHLLGPLWIQVVPDRSEL
jgi:hypothetical protein